MPLPQVPHELRAKPAVISDVSPMQHVTEERNRIAKSLSKFSKRIGIHSGKGGVGKTLIACAIARALAEDGEEVGLIDADIDCPNVPITLGVQERMTIDDAGLLQPIRAKGIEVVSTGFLQNDTEPLIVRGPIKHRILTDFVEKVAWRPCDTLVIDFPPGTSDVPLSAMQFIGMHGILLVTTPQRESLADVTRAARMAQTLSVPVLGLIVNMEGDVFGTVSDSFAASLGTSIVARIPLLKIIRECDERGDNPLELPVLSEQRSAILATVYATKHHQS